ncbi:MAG: hypothetical protein K0S33_160 [Bacteroidetes bacterium]|jgi:hypothetical protein|nr:hypothetical protein [Bacteroidota bacterium]
MKELKIKDILELVFRVYVFVFLNLYAIGKLMGGQFYTPARMPEEVASLSLGAAGNFELAWVFMGRSFGYILFAGITQLIGAWLLLFNRTKLIGAAILIPVMVNIVVFDVFFLDKYGALANAGIYLAMLLFILLFNKEKVVSAIRALTDFSLKVRIPLKYRIYKICIAIAVFALIFVLNQLLVNLLGHGKG